MLPLCCIIVLYPGDVHKVRHASFKVKSFRRHFLISSVVRYAQSWVGLDEGGGAHGLGLRLGLTAWAYGSGSWLGLRARAHGSGSRLRPTALAREFSVFGSDSGSASLSLVKGARTRVRSGRFSAWACDSGWREIRLALPSIRCNIYADGHKPQVMAAVPSSLKSCHDLKLKI